MTSTISTDALTKLCQILTEKRAPLRAQSVLTRFERELLQAGVAINFDLRDYLISTETRCCSSIEHLAEQLFGPFAISQQYLFRRPIDPNDEVAGSAGLIAVDIAAFLIGLESLGLQVDPSRLVKHLSPKLKGQSLLTNSEFEVEMYAHYMGKQKVRLQAVRDPVTTLRESCHTDALGYRYQMLWQGEAVVSLEVLGPHYQPPEVQELVRCEYCGYEYMTNNTAEARIHAEVHGRYQKLYDPAPDQRFADHRASHVSGEGERVDPESPVWMHGEVYERAAEFRREFSYDFVQWPGSWMKPADEGWEGHLFALGEEGTVAGACAFMQSAPDKENPGWALQWIWVAPKYRRSGLLEARWPEFLTLYGDFHIEHPISPAMQEFVRKNGTDRQKELASVTKK